VRAHLVVPRAETRADCLSSCSDAHDIISVTTSNSACSSLSNRSRARRPILTSLAPLAVAYHPPASNSVSSKPSLTLPSSYRRRTDAVSPRRRSRRPSAVSPAHPSSRPSSRSSSGSSSSSSSPSPSSPSAVGARPPTRSGSEQRGSSGHEREGGSGRATSRTEQGGARASFSLFVVEQCSA